MFMKKKEEKDLSWYQDKLSQLYDELYVVRKEYATSLAKRYYPEFKDKIGRYYNLWNVLVCKLFLIGINGIVQTPKSTRCLATDVL